MPISSVAKATSSICKAPKLSSRLGGFHIIILAAFTLLGFYVCFKQLKTINSEVLSLKAMLKIIDDGQDEQVEQQKEEEDYEHVEEDMVQEINDAGLRDMLNGLVGIPGVMPDQGVTIVVGEDEEPQAEIEEIVEKEVVNDEPVKEEENVDNLSSLSVKDLKTIAAEKNIPVKPGAKKADIIASIKSSEIAEE